ncbi:flavin reductase [Actinomadura macrotermitis]|uniref:FMN reductase (NADH) RutF n=1 Tax=Actinomadura macrotermitis TaxID=2585200 RepID=A0A7K0BTY0_9ACTN|nr:flavin reductase [Actinomadura macrotermitis]MQY04648.1 FMN reductase (NADH) RutF [Actinomadura macrotermitis]
MSTKGAELEHVLDRLRSLLKEVWDEHPADLPVDGDATLLSLGVDSLTLVSLLDRVEAEFHTAWDPDDPPDAYSSLRSIAIAASPAASGPAGSGRRHVGLDAYRSLMSAFPTGVAVVTSIGADMLPRGATCSSLCSVTLSPPTLLVCLKAGSTTLEAITTRQSFAVNLLNAGARRAAEIFASPVADRFAHVDWRPTGAEGLPWLESDALAVAECAVAGMLDVGDHAVVLGEVVGAEILAGEPLLYGRRRFSAWMAGGTGR